MRVLVRSRYPTLLKLVPGAVLRHAVKQQQTGPEVISPDLIHQGYPALTPMSSVERQNLTWVVREIGVGIPANVVQPARVLT